MRCIVCKVYLGTSMFKIRAGHVFLSIFNHKTWHNSLHSSALPSERGKETCVDDVQVGSHRLHLDSEAVLLHALTVWPPSPSGSLLASYPCAVDVFLIRKSVVVGRALSLSLTHNLTLTVEDVSSCQPDHVELCKTKIKNGCATKVWVCTRVFLSLSKVKVPPFVAGPNLCLFAGALSAKLRFKTDTWFLGYSLMRL